MWLARHVVHAYDLSSWEAETRRSGIIIRFIEVSHGYKASTGPAWVTSDLVSNEKEKTSVARVELSESRPGKGTKLSKASHIGPWGPTGTTLDFIPRVMKSQWVLSDRMGILISLCLFSKVDCVYI